MWSKLAKVITGWQPINMKGALFLILSLISLSSLAQQSDTLYSYTNIGGKEIKKDKAVNVYKVYRRDSTSWIRTTSDRNLVLVKKETFFDKELTLLNGSYSEYRNGKTSLKGQYADGAKTDQWITYDSTGTVTKVETYAFNKLNGPFISYWENGKIREQSNYTSGRRVGEWKLFYENGNLALKERFDNYGKLSDSAYFDLEHNPTRKSDIIKPAKFPSGQMAFFKEISKNIKYPYDAVRTNTQGKVNLTFRIAESGKIEDVNVVSAPTESIAAEALRVVQDMSAWIPATFQNKPISTAEKMNVNFTLSSNSSRITRY